MIGDWIQTYTSQRLYPLSPRLPDINIEDIAHSLSLTCRFTGHCKYHYSVATHSLFVAEKCSGGNEIYGLMHDAAEAYLADVARPVKPSLAGFKEIEDCLLGSILNRFGLHHRLPKEIHEIDSRMCMTEARVLMNDPQDWDLIAEPYDDVVIMPMDMGYVEELFLKKFYEYLEV